MTPLNNDAQIALGEIFDNLGSELDITEKQHNDIVTSYNTVGSWLADSGSVLAPFEPQIRPQGSFMLGTMVSPCNEEDQLDIDLVCRLMGKLPDWTQHHLKQIVGTRLKTHNTYSKMLDEEGRRCWTLNYSESARYHMDILPAIVNSDFDSNFQKAIMSHDLSNVQDLAIRITDNHERNYFSSTNVGDWPKSNPFGYGAWFQEQARLNFIKAYSLRDAVQPVPVYQKNKSPLQRVVQILKRHRDQRFNGDSEKPISIIITTLAAKAYQKEANVYDALTSVSARLVSMVEERYDAKHKRVIKWIANPVNDQENFADKWPDNPQLEINFYKWVQWLQSDLLDILKQIGNGYHKIQEAMEKPFGKKAVNATFSTIGNNARTARENGKIYMASATGIVGTVGRTVIPNHNNFGSSNG